MHPRVYNSNFELVSILENAYAIDYELPLNSLYTASFSLPYTDPKNKECEPFNYVEIFDGDERIELFRILPSENTNAQTREIKYSCEHVLATLMDDVLFKYHQIGNKGVYTTQSIRYVLDKQHTKRWVLVENDFKREFEYKWENENLLAALFSIPKPFDSDYIWEYNTTYYPWSLYLKKRSKEPTSDVIYMKNMESISKTKDPKNIVTRLYCLGYGEGDNQLTISSVNNGIPYLEANVDKWGLKNSILVDRRFENPETLKAYGQRILDEAKDPYLSYKVNVVDLFKLDNRYSKFKIGDYVRIHDTEDDLIVNLPIIKISKSDITSGNMKISIDIANKKKDIAGSISQLQERTKINEVYAQGATNQMIIPFVDNADTKHPAIIKFYIPDTMVRINKVIVNFEFEDFRAYSKAIKGGGGNSTTSSSGGGYNTTSGGGGGSSTTTSAGGGTYNSTDYGGGDYGSTESGGGDYTSTDSGGGEYLTTSQDNTAEWWRYGGGFIPADFMNMELSGKYRHSHAINASHTHSHTHSTRVSDHSHSVKLPNHTHQVQIPNHTHSFQLSDHTHSIDIKDHTHSINIPDHTHTITLPDHTHEIEYGIYQENKSDNKAKIKIGKKEFDAEPNKDIDLIDYVETDNHGKILRNHWHTIQIIPTKLVRIRANVFLQIFTNSRGGGDK